MKVEYVQERIRENLSGHKSIPKSLEDRLLRTKADYWRYEEELRRLVDLSKANREQGLYFLPFDNEMALAEVILGPLVELPLDSIRELTRATSPNAVVFQIEIGIDRSGSYPMADLWRRFGIPERLLRVRARQNYE